jgi:hypothetical protein
VIGDPQEQGEAGTGEPMRVKKAVEALGWVALGALLLVPLVMFFDHAAEREVVDAWARMYGPNGTRRTTPTPWPTRTPEPALVISTPAPITVEHVVLVIPQDIDTRTLSPACARALVGAWLRMGESAEGSARWHDQFAAAQRACPQFVQRSTW